VGRNVIWPPITYENAADGTAKPELAKRFITLIDSLPTVIQTRDRVACRMVYDKLQESKEQLELKELCPGNPDRALHLTRKIFVLGHWNLKSCQRKIINCRPKIFFADTEMTPNEMENDTARGK